MPETLYTIGYEKRTQEEFFGILARAKIGVLMDVRDVAWSHKPGFSKGSLVETCMTAGLVYEHAQFAGNPKALRATAPDLEGLLAFYRSPLGRRLIAIQPSIVRDSGQIGQRWGAQLGAMVSEQLAKEGVQLNP